MAAGPDPLPVLHQSLTFMRFGKAARACRAVRSAWRLLLACSVPATPANEQPDTHCGGPASAAGYQQSHTDEEEGDADHKGNHSLAVSPQQEVLPSGDRRPAEGGRMAPRGRGAHEGRMDEDGGTTFGEQSHDVVSRRLQRRRGCNRGAVCATQRHLRARTRWTVEFDEVTHGDARQLLIRVKHDDGNRGGESVGVNGIQQGDGPFLVLLKHDPGMKGGRRGGVGITHAGTFHGAQHNVSQLCWRACSLPRPGAGAATSGVFT